MQIFEKWYRNLTSNRSFHPRQALIQLIHVFYSKFISQAYQGEGTAVFKGITKVK